jgi:RND family efflux transporter MFP subunit
MKRLVTGASLVLSLAGLTACGQQEAPPQKDARHVETVVVAAAPVSTTLSTTGEIRARVQSDLSFRVSGRIVERSVDVGERVQRGQVLARIDAQEQKADLEVADATLQSAQAQQTQAKQAFDRQQNLFTTGVTTRAALDDAQEALLTAEGTINSAQAQVDTARDALAQTELKADADGIITARNAEVGQVAQAAQVVFTLAHDGPRDAVINADEAALLGGKFENDIEVRLLSGGRPIAARVREVSPTIDTSTGTIRVKLALDEDPSLRLGSPVIATARYQSMSATELPWSAMASSSGQAAIWVIDPGSRKVSLRPVEVNGYATGKFSVKAGLSVGDIVVTNGTKFLTDGEVVTYEGASQ